MGIIDLCSDSIVYPSKVIKSLCALVLLLGIFFALPSSACAGINMTREVRKCLGGELKKSSPRFLYIADNVLQQYRNLSTATISHDVIGLLLSPDTECYVETNTPLRKRGVVGEQEIPKLILVNAKLNRYCVFGNHQEDIIAFRKGKLGFLNDRDVLLASYYSTKFRRDGMNYREVKLSLSITEGYLGPYGENYSYIRLRQVAESEAAPEEDIASGVSVSTQDERDFEEHGEGMAEAFPSNEPKIKPRTGEPNRMSFTVVGSRRMSESIHSSTGKTTLNGNAKPFCSSQTQLPPPYAREHVYGRAYVLCLGGVLDAAATEFCACSNYIYHETLRMMVFERNQAFLLDSGRLVLQYDDINVIFDRTDSCSLCPLHPPVCFDRIVYISRLPVYEQKIVVDAVVDTIVKSEGSNQLVIRLIKNPYAEPKKLRYPEKLPQCLCLK